MRKHLPGLIGAALLTLALIEHEPPLQNLHAALVQLAILTLAVPASILGWRLGGGRIDRDGLKKLWRSWTTRPPTEDG